MARRVVITSMNVVSALGTSSHDIIDNLRNDQVNFKSSVYDEDLTVCPVLGFDLKAHTGRLKTARYLNRGAQFSVASAMETARQAGLGPEMLQKAGLFVGSGPNLDIGGEFPEIQNGCMDRPDLPALWILRFLPNTAASIIASILGIHGENATIATACSAGLQAIGEAFRKIRHGDLDLAFAGAGDSRLNAGGLLAYQKARALLEVKDADHRYVYSPFAAVRKGFVPGEGGAFFLLESMDHAKSRGKEIIAEVCGFGATLDGTAMTAPEPSGVWAEKAVRSALDQAGMISTDIDAVFAHGTGTELNDQVEANLIDRMFHPHRPLILALKSWIGHLAAACGAVELAIGLICMQHGYLPEIRNLKIPCHQRLDFIKKAVSVSPSGMLFQNFGFGGQNAALVIRAWKE